MKIKTIAAAAALAFLLTSCSSSQQPADTEDTSAATTTPPTTTTTTEPTTTMPPEPVYSDDCEAHLESFAISEENIYMTSPMEYGIDEENGVLSVSIDYYNYVDIYTLQNCILDISVSGGEYSVEEALNANGTVDLTRLDKIVLTDEEGLKRKYDVVTERTFYDLPIVNIYLEDMAAINSIDKNIYSEMTFFIDNSGAEEFSSTDVISGRIRGRGHSTWRWAKKPYRIKLDEAVSVLGLDENKDWILLANYSDKSLIRNTLAYTMGRSLDGLDWSPTQYPVDLFVNGQYRGVYSIGEHMEVGKDRVDIEKNSTDVDTGYLLEIGGKEDGDVFMVDYFHTAKELLNFVVIKSPDRDEITDEQREYIRNYLNEAETAIISGTGYEDYIDVDSFCDWIIIHELTYNLDSCFRRSCYMTKDKGGKLKMGPIWDFDLAFGNYDIDNKNYNNWVTIGFGTTFEQSYVLANPCNYLIKNSNFRQRLRERWFEVRDDLMKTAMDCIDYYSDRIYRSQQENFNVWKIWGIKAGFQSDRNLEYESYELQIQYLKDFLNMRAEWLDNNM